MSPEVRNLTASAHALSASDRKAHYGHPGGVLWLTGLSASGKSSLAMALEQALMAQGYSCYVLDGDNVRSGLNSNLGFSPEDRTENIRRVSEVAALFSDAGLICITAFISPYYADRAQARLRCKQPFHEIHVAADLATCEARDPKGLYKKARAGEIKQFTGIDSPYEAPSKAEIVVKTGENSLEECAQQVIDWLQQHNYIPAEEPALLNN